MALNQPFRTGRPATLQHPQHRPDLLAPNAKAWTNCSNAQTFAMYEAKAAGRNTHRFFDPGMQFPARTLQPEADLRQGLSRGDLYVHYQPVVDYWPRQRRRSPGLLEPPRTRPINPAEFIPWPNRPASSCPWQALSCTPRANNSYAGAANRKPPT